MLSAAMGRPRKVSRRAAIPMSPSARLNMLSPKRQEIIRPALWSERSYRALKLCPRSSTCQSRPSNCSSRPRSRPS